MTFAPFKLNIQYDAQTGTFSSQPPLQAEACKRTGEGCLNANTHKRPQLGRHPNLSSGILHSV